MGEKQKTTSAEKIIFKVVSNIAFLGIGVAILIYVFGAIDTDKVVHQVIQANYWWIVFAKLLGLTAHWLRGLRWRMLLRPIGSTPSALNAFYAVMIGYLTNLAVPRMGEVMRVWSLNKTDKTPVADALGTVVVERIIDVLIMLFLVGGVIMLNYRLLRNFLINELLGPYLKDIDSRSMILFILLGIIIIMVGVLIYTYKGRIKGLEGSIINRFLDGMRSITMMKNRWNFLALTLGIWIFYIVGFYMHFMAFESLSSIGIINAVTVFAFGTLAMLAPVQGGIGAYHWMVMQAMILVGFLQADGLALATVVHGTAMLMIMVIGGLSLGLVMWKGKR